MYKHYRLLIGNMQNLYSTIKCKTISLKLYCRYFIYKALYDKSYLGSKTNYDFRWMDMLDFICNGSVDLFGTGRERKIQNENICLQRDSNLHPASPRQESCSALDRSATLVRYQVEHYSLTAFWNGYVTCMKSVMVWYPMQSSVNNYYTS